MPAPHGCLLRSVSGSNRSRSQVYGTVLNRIPMIRSIPLLIIILLGCTHDGASQSDAGAWPICSSVPQEFVAEVQRTLTDSTDLFRGAYPPATPLTCELLSMLQEELKNDSSRYCFDRLSRRYWGEDPHARLTHTYIARHLNFALAMAATAHWNEDHRILGSIELMDYRRMRPMVCGTKEGYARLEQQDRAAVRYLISVLETTPIFIIGSENATIHDTNIRTVMRTLDTFTGQQHDVTGDQRLRVDMSEDRLRKAIAEWRSWLTP